MTNLDGQIFFAFIVAIILSLLSGWIIARWYKHTLLSVMQTGGAPVDETAVENAITFSSSIQSELSLKPLSNQNKAALWRYRVAISCISLTLAIIISLYWQHETIAESFSLKRTLLLTLTYAWPMLACVGLLEHWSRWRVVCLSIFYMMLVNLLIMINSNQAQSLIDIIIWSFGQQIPALIFIIILAGPNLRTLGPYLLLIFFLLISSSLAGYEILDMSLDQNNTDSWIIDLAGYTNATVVFILFGIMPWLIAFFPLRFLAKKLSDCYQQKYFSDPLYLIAGVWLIFLLFQSMTLSHSLNLFAYTLLISWLIIPLGFYCLRIWLKPKHMAPTLLLLRVFRSDDSIGKLFDKVLERWRYSGNTVMIAGKDLALRTLEPDQLFAFINGRLRQQFIQNQIQLQRNIAQLDLKPDPDGRYRVNDFFCFDSTWKMVLETLVAQTELVLMDLRDYITVRKGCTYELQVLANSQHLQKIIIVINTDTDKNSAVGFLGNKAKDVIWVEDHSNQDNLEQRLLAALLG